MNFPEMLVVQMRHVRLSTPLRYGVLREGSIRYASGTTPTQYTYTGQYSNVSEFGLMYYNARWYDPLLGRFAQADALVPGGASLSGMYYLALE